MKVQFCEPYDNKWLKEPELNERNELSGYAYLEVLEDVETEVFVAAELFGVEKDELAIEQEYDAELFFYLHHLEGINEEGEAASEIMANESIIPSGAMPLDREDFEFSPTNIISVTVEHIMTEEEVPHPDNLILFEGALLGTQLHMVIAADRKESLPELKEGYCIYGEWWCEAFLNN